MNRELYNRLVQAKGIYQQWKDTQDCIKQKNAALDELKEPINSADQAIRELQKGQTSKHRYEVANIIETTYSKIPYAIAIIMLVLQIIITITIVTLFAQPLRIYENYGDAFYVFLGMIGPIVSAGRVLSFFSERDKEEEIEKSIGDGVKTILFSAGAGYLWWCFFSLEAQWIWSEGLYTELFLVSIGCTAISVICYLYRRLPAHLSDEKKDKMYSEARKKDIAYHNEMLEACKLDKQEAEAEYAKRAPALHREIEQLEQQIPSFQNQISQILGAYASRLNLETVKTLISYHDKFFVDMRREPNDLDDLIAYVNVKEAEFAARLRQLEFEGQMRAREARDQRMRDLDRDIKLSQAKSDIISAINKRNN